MVVTGGTSFPAVALEDPWWNLGSVSLYSTYKDNCGAEKCICISLDPLLGLCQPVYFGQ